MIIFLYGPDAYRRHVKLREIVLQYTKKHSALTVREFDCDDDAAHIRFKTALNERSLFDTQQLLVVRNFFPLPEAMQKDWEVQLKAMQDRKELTLVILAADKPLKRFVFLLSAPTIAQEFADLTDAQFETFIKQEASRVGARLTPQLLVSLRNAYIPDTWAVVTELARIALGGELVSDLSPALNVFAAAGTLLRSGGATTALPLLERLLANEDPAYIFNCLAYQSSGKSRDRFADDDVAVKSGRSIYDMVLLDRVLVLSEPKCLY